MKVSEFPRPYQELYGVQAALVRLGFDLATTYLGYGNVKGNPDVLYIQLQSKAGKFNMGVARIPGETLETVKEKFNEFSEAVKEATDDELHTCYRETVMGSNVEAFARLVQSLKSKGIHIPALAGKVSAAS